MCGFFGYPHISCRPNPIFRYLEGFEGCMPKVLKEAKRVLKLLKQEKHEMCCLGRINKPLSSEEQRK